MPEGTGHADSLDLFGDIQQDADAGKGEEERGSAGGDEGERDALGGEQREHHADVEEGLKQNRRGDAEGDEARKGIVERKAVRRPRKPRTTKSITMEMAPMKPSSSAMLAKMKSVEASGR